MVNSIRVRSATEYIIEVSDNGDTISFDTSDTGLTSKLASTFDKINALVKEYEIKASEIEAQSDEPYSTTTIKNNETGQTEVKTLITKNQYESSKLIDRFYVDARAAMDTFLGEGACKKIFGDKNYYNMFNDLTKQLEPHFKKMGINAEKLKETGVQRHSPNRQQRRTLK
ncbi:hypothetical protein AAFA46_08085 [Oscillospiraceae bacterium WX1]